MKTIIDHRLYGQIVYDDETSRVTVQRENPAARLSWLMRPENAQLFGWGYYPNRFLHACELAGIMTSGVEKDPQ